MCPGRDVLASDSGEALDECEGEVGDFRPAVVDDQRVATVFGFGILGDTLVLRLKFVGAVGERDGRGVVLRPGDDQ